jgi:adenylosuccinate lyase
MQGGKKEMVEERRNLFLPGNLRYQPEELIPHFGYDNLYKKITEVEIATMEVLGEIGVIPEEEMKTLQPLIVKEILSIPTTEIDRIEREITHHDIRAWVRKAQEIINGKLSRWVHIPNTSYDVIDTARALQFRDAYQYALSPAISEVVDLLSKLVKKFAGQIQIGRTHGQHALPITVGFWLATILNRIVYNWQKMDACNNHLVGHIAGAVGAYNAQIGLKFTDSNDQQTFEEKVLQKLNLKPARISTQIAPPEPLAYFLFSCCMLSATLAQFGEDGRHLMRSEIAEVIESYENGQAGSSTMAHKRNPMNFEALKGMWVRTKNEFGKVLDTPISEHQRDLTGSSVARDFPIILINLQQQLNTLRKKNEDGVPFLSRITVDQDACQRNFEMSSHLILAEPIYIALQMAGFLGDAHELVNRKLVPIAIERKVLLVEILEEFASDDPDLQKIINVIPGNVWELLHHPENYIGDAEAKALEIAAYADEWTERMEKIRR